MRFTADYFHGNTVFGTAFRNYLLGSDLGRIDNLIAFTLTSWNRYWNVVGNVLGSPGVTTAYTGAHKAVYKLGWGYGNLPNDPLVETTLLRWGNYDTVNAATRWLASEVPSGLSEYANAVPVTQSLPPSLYLSAAPSWWPASKPWPAIGPDVRGGNIEGLGGHVYSIPARDCYVKMGGPVDGSGGALTFNAASCY